MVTIRLLATLALLGPTAAVAQDAMVPDADTAVAAADLPFAPEAEGQPQELAPVWGDRATGPAGTYLRTPGGWVAPLHTHTADYRGIVIAGTWSHWVPATGATDGAPLGPGSTWTQVADEPHADACLSEEACTILLINEAPYATALAE